MGTRTRWFVKVVAVLSLSGAVVFAQTDTVRRLCIAEDASIASGLKPGDRLVVLDCQEQEPLSINAYSATDTLEGFAHAEWSGVIDKVETSSRELSNHDHIQTTIRARAVRTISSKSTSIKSGDHVEFVAAGGELNIKDVRVQTARHALWKPGGQYLIALSHNSRGEVVADYWARIDANGRLRGMEFVDRTIGTGFEGRTLTMFLSELRRRYPK